MAGNTHFGFDSCLALRVTCSCISPAPRLAVLQESDPLTFALGCSADAFAQPVRSRKTAGRLKKQALHKQLPAYSAVYAILRRCAFKNPAEVSKDTFI